MVCWNGVDFTTRPQHTCMTPLPRVRRLIAARRTVLAVALIGACSFAPLAKADEAALAGAGDIQTEYEAETERFRGELGELAAWCRERKLAAEEKRVAGWLPTRAPDKSYFFLIDSAAELAAAELLGEGTGDAEFAARFTKLREAHAGRLFALAQAAAKEQEYSLAVKFVYETLREQPQHPEAMKLLGYQVVGGTRLSPYELTKQRAGYVWHAAYGWIKQDQVARYEKGERNLGGRWVSAADDARIHATMRNPWYIDTENFRIATNHSLEEGVRLATSLEKLNQVWRQLFARYHTPEAEWKRLFEGGEPRRDPARKLNNVVYYRTKAEYVNDLVKFEPLIGITSGIFLNRDDKAYFFADPEKNQDSFLFHEVTHQLFALSKRTLKVGERGNFWIVEGIACQMESLKLHDDFAELGGSDNPRMLAARARFKANFYMPLVDFTALSRDQLQKNPDIKALYSQASGLASFLMYGEQGKYREAAVDFLDAIYTNKDTPLTLTQRIGRSYSELDADYRRYLESLPGPVPELK